MSTFLLPLPLLASLFVSASASTLVKRKEDECATIPIEEYKVGLHVGAIFIVVACSLLGSMSPVAFKSLKSKTGATILMIGRAFGGGTILATGFIHSMFSFSFVFNIW